VFYQIFEALRRKFILELRRYWSYHPQYRDIVDSIQGKFSFEERPQYGIIVKNGGGSHIGMSADNYRGMVKSYVYKALYQDCPGVAVEWVREDAIAIQRNGGRFPSPPGVYYIDLTEDDEYYIDRLLDVFHEQVTLIDGSHGQLQHVPLARSARIYEMPSGFLLVEGTNYTIDESGGITLTRELNQGQWLSADYRYPGESSGPHQIVPMHANNQVIPGVVVAFGRRNEKGDRVAVVVQDLRRPAAREYGGRWSMSLDFDIMARDVYAQQEIHDQTVMFLWGIARNRLSTEGYEIMDISLGGESEEIHDEAGDDYFYNATFSVTVETEWAVWVPLVASVRQAAAMTHNRAGEIGNMTDDEVAGQVCDIKENLETLGLGQVKDPFFFLGNGYPLIR
jgi:hypothetical protein